MLKSGRVARQRRAIGRRHGLLPGSQIGDRLPRDAILAAARRVAADALGLSSTLGTIAAGKVGDLVTLAAGPRQDLGSLHKPVAVLKASSVVAGALPN